MGKVGIRGLVGVGLVLLGGVTALAHFPIVETEKGVVGIERPVVFLLSSGHPFMNDRVDAPKIGRVGVYPPDRRFRSLSKTTVAVVTSLGTKAYRVTHVPKFSGDWIYSFHCGETLEKPQRRVADYVKVILHVRHETGAQVGWRRVIGDPMEIVPMTRPYLIPVGSVFRGKVVFNSKLGPRDFKSRPMLEGVVEAESYTPDRRPGHSYLPANRLGVTTDRNGVFAITLPTRGWWLLTVATDGGPGEQGLSKVSQRRASLWVQVGGTVYDRYPPIARAAPVLKAQVSRRSPRGKVIPVLSLTSAADLAALTTRLQQLDLLEIDRLPEVEGYVLETNHMWGLRRVEIRGGLLAITDNRGQVEFFRDSHRLIEWLNERLAR
ncbi:MAG: DUF4198 domain-containing protein [Planctomycetes bacterium]|nr:DUF4198 domain-containing protein [Planctomycetota bacterium]